jgi:hypothetical protein
MSTADRRGKTFHGLLEREAGSHADAIGIAIAARRLCERLADQLSPIVGTAGIEAICSRSLHLTRRQFPSLAPIEQKNGSFAHLEASLRGLEPEAAIDASVAVLVTACGLLDVFIGESLTTLLLRGAWPDFHDGTKERV